VRYGGVLLSAPLHASVTLHNLLNVPVQFANKMGFQKKKKLMRDPFSGDALRNFLFAAVLVQSAQ
jgi:hypothetical protein